MRRRFEDLVRAHGDGVDVVLAALFIAAEADPGMDPARERARIAALAELARPVLEGEVDPRRRMERLAAFFRAQGFRGNREGYYDPRNSYLQEVLSRRTGIPLTLALLHLEVGRALGWPLDGVSFPGRFLVKHRVDGREGDVVLDPFDGRLLDESDCRALFEQAMGPAIPFDRRWLRAATAREILARLLGNLKQIFVQAERWEDALACCDRILVLSPDAPGELRDRGVVLQRLECFGPARRDLERFLALAPDDPSADAVRELLVEVRAQAERVS